VERRMLHGEIAQELEKLYETRIEDITVQLARHYQEAGNNEAAVKYLIQSGDQARRYYAHQEATEFYQQAMPFLRKQPDPERAARTLMKLGLTYHNAFDYNAARGSFEEGFLFWQRMAEEKRHPGASAQAPHPLRVLTLEPTNLSHLTAMDFPSHVVLDQLFSGLVEVSPDLDLVPDIAVSWEVLDGGRKYIFHLREDVYWSDGVQVTADDFEFTLKRILSPAGDRRWHVYLSDIKNAVEYNQGEISDDILLGIHALDQFTLSIDLIGPASYFPYITGFHSIYPAPRHVFAAADPGVEPGLLVNNGPFTLASWKRGESLVLERNLAYHGQFTGNVQRVECNFLSGQYDKFLQRYQEHSVDMCIGLPFSEIVGARQRFAEDYVSGPWMASNFIGFDVRKPPFNSHQVRRAFALALDHDALADVTLMGYAFPAIGGLIPPDMPGHSPGINSPYDPEAARQALAEAGYPDGKGFPEVDCFVRDDPGHDLASVYLQNQALKVLDVRINCKPVRWGEFYQLMQQNSPSMWMVSWYADYPDPD
ncbi:MAG: ABC transporter substrate-binding protein, partial [Anaerolineales bacterium]|nr:ABC transporter substrate-binding protein [Anaerolineales bacterium]